MTITNNESWHKQSISRGLVRPQLVEATKREDNPERRRVPPPAARARLRPHARQRDAAHAAVVAARLRRVGLPHRRRRARAPDDPRRRRGRAPDHRQPQDAHAHARRRRRGRRAAHLEARGRRRSRPATSSVSAACAIVDPTHHLFTLQDDRDINVELYVNKGRGYVEADQHAARSRPAGRPRPHRLDLQPGSPRELLGRRDARRPAHRLRSPDADGRDERHDHARRGGELRRRAGADALPVLRRLRLARVGAASALAATAAGGDAQRLARAAHDADRRPRAVGPLGELAQELEHPHAGRSRSPDREPDPAGQELRQEVAAGDRRSPRARRT